MVEKKSSPSSANTSFIVVLLRAFRHGEEPTGLAFGEPDDRLRDEAIQNHHSYFWIACAGNNGFKRRCSIDCPVRSSSWQRACGRSPVLRLAVLRIPFGKIDRAVAGGKRNQKSGPQRQVRYIDHRNVAD